VTFRLECIKDETINNLTMKRVVCPSAVQNVGTFGEHQNDQVSTQGLLAFLRGEYNKNNKSFSVNEDDLASSPNLKDMCQKEALPIGHNNWHGKEYDLLDDEGVFLMKGCVTVSDPRESILDDILGHDHDGLTIFYLHGDILAIMTIWKWSLIQTTMEGFLLKEFLLSYDENYVLKVDVEGMIGVKKNKYSFNKRKQKEIVFVNFVLRIEKVLNDKSCHGIGATMCCSLDYCQHFPCQMTRIFRHEF